MNGEVSVLLLSDDPEADWTPGHFDGQDQTAAGAEAEHPGYVPHLRVQRTDYAGKVKTPPKRGRTVQGQITQSCLIIAHERKIGNDGSYCNRT